jgi:uncharacterized protein DUF3237
LPEALKGIQKAIVRVARAGAAPADHRSNGQTPNAFRRVGLIQGGSFEGERLFGEVVSGNDWQAVRTDSCLKLDVRLVLKTTDGALIIMTYQCLRAGPPSVIEKLDKGETVDPHSYYFRMSPMFETSAPKYDWMNRIIAIGKVTECPTVPSTTSLRFSDSLAAFRDLLRKQIARDRKPATRVSPLREFVVFDRNGKKVMCNDETDELRSGHSPSVYRSRHSRHEQGM